MTVEVVVVTTVTSTRVSLRLHVYAKPTASPLYHPYLPPVLLLNDNEVVNINFVVIVNIVIVAQTREIKGFTIASRIHQKRVALTLPLQQWKYYLSHQRLPPQKLLLVLCHLLP
jgi:hypothetical protein